MMGTAEQQFVICARVQQSSTVKMLTAVYHIIFIKWPEHIRAAYYEPHVPYSSDVKSHIQKQVSGAFWNLESTCTQLWICQNIKILRVIVYLTKLINNLVFVVLASSLKKFVTRLFHSVPLSNCLSKIYKGYKWKAYGRWFISIFITQNSSTFLVSCNKSERAYKSFNCETCNSAFHWPTTHDGSRQIQNFPGCSEWVIQWFVRSQLGLSYKKTSKTHVVGQQPCFIRCEYHPVQL